MSRAKSSVAADLMDKAGFTRSRAYLYARGTRLPDLNLALEIYRKTGHQLGPLRGATERQIKTLMGLPAAEEAA